MHKEYPTKSKRTSSNLFDLEFGTTSDKHIIANAFCEYFSNVVNKLKKAIFPLRNLIWRASFNVNSQTTKQFKFQLVSETIVLKQPQAASERCYVNIGVLRICILNNIFRNFWSKSLKNTCEEVHFLLSCRL